MKSDGQDCKKLQKTCRILDNNGFAIMEIILIMVVIGIIAANIMVLQKSSWSMSGSSNKLLLAGQMIDRQVETMRMSVDRNPSTNFPPHDSSITENGITLKWKFSTVTRSVGTKVVIDNVRECNLTAGWGKSKWDSLKVRTYLARNF
jgi:type II secretory pathway pseudopilin PulG